MAARRCRLSVIAALSVIVVPMPVEAALRVRAHHTHRHSRFTEPIKPRTSPKPRESRALRQRLRLLVEPAAPFAGQLVTLRVLGAPAGADYLWHVNGQRRVRATGNTPHTSLRIHSPGSRRLWVWVVEANAAHELSLVVIVRRARTHTSAQRHLVDRRDRLVTRRRIRAERLRSQPRPAHTARVARAAGDPGVTIADYHFSPTTTTIHAGDTVTWTNNGPSSHTATARDGSFDTGVLSKGSSASHTFTQPGTFTYFCRIHPIMHGTIVVLAAATASTPSHGGSRGTSAASQTTAGAGSSGTAGHTLPFTGMNVVSVFLVGMILWGAGISLRFARGR